MPGAREDGLEVDSTNRWCLAVDLTTSNDKIVTTHRMEILPVQVIHPEVLQKAPKRLIARSVAVRLGSCS